MATITFTETFDGRGGDVGDNGDKSFPRYFHVSTDDGAVGAPEIVAHPDCPKYGRPYVPTSGPPDVDFGVTVRRLSLRQKNDSNTEWLLTVTYSSKQDGGAAGGGGSGGGPGSAPGGGPQGPSEQGPALGQGGGGPPAPTDVSGHGAPVNAPPQHIENPLLRPPKVRWRTVKQTEIVTKDKDGKVICNSAGNKFDPPVERPRSRKALMITRNQAVFNSAAVSGYLDTVNSHFWLGQAEKTMRFDDVDASFEVENGIGFWVCSYSFEKEPKGWNPHKVLDAGWEEKVSGELKRITDKFGAPIRQPWPLNGAGAKIADPTVSNAVYRDFNIYEEADFNDFQFFQ